MGVRTDMNIPRLYCHTFFVNNRDLFSQIDYVICLADVVFNVNIIHWFFIKCKRVTRNVLAAKLYDIIHDFDIELVIKTTLERMLKNTSLILCTNSKFLYDCLVRLEITQEKRLMIDVMSLRQSYERREIIEMKWIHDHNNLVDVMIKSKTSSILRTVIDTNRINLDTTEWVKRDKKNDDSTSST